MNLQELQRELESTTAATPADLAKAPPGKWSTAEILEHLYLTYRGTNKGIERCLAAGQPLARRATLKDRIQTLVVVGFKYMPNGRKAPERAAPRGMSGEEVVRAIIPEIQQVSAGLDQCERKFGPRTKIFDHPIL